jgi:hypothetical protein
MSMPIVDGEVEEGKYRPFSYIRDNYPRFPFTCDPLHQRRDVVRHAHPAGFRAVGEELLTQWGIWLPPAKTQSRDAIASHDVK